MENTSEKPTNKLNPISLPLPNLVPKEIPDDEIIIKGDVKDLAKHFVKDYIVLWHDPNINSQMNAQYITQLELLCEVKVLTEWKEASEAIQKLDVTMCNLITSELNAELLIKDILPQITKIPTIYITTDNDCDTLKKLLEKSKTSLYFEKNMDNLIKKLEENIVEWQREASSLKVGLPAFAPIFDNMDRSAINFNHFRLKGFIDFKNRAQAKRDFIKPAKTLYRDRANIKEFETNYSDFDMKTILHWYTRQSFFFKVTNNCLRIATSDAIQYCRLALKDLETAIKEQYEAKSKDFSGLLYRGTYLSENEWNQLQQNIGQEIEMYGFLSTSKRKEIAKKFLSSDQGKKALVTIIVPQGPNEGEEGFAEIAEFAIEKFKKEEEVLFNVRSRFTILETTTETSPKGVNYRHLVLLYGAQAWRKHLKLHDCLQNIPIEDKICVECKSQTESLYYKSLSKENEYICSRCLESYLKNNQGPLLCIPSQIGVFKERTIEGRVMIYPEDLKIPFYGYKCVNCQLKPDDMFYFTCIECTGKKKIWCKECMLQGVDCLTLENHNVILEKIPFSFWHKKMTENEFQLLKHEAETTLVHENLLFFQSMIFTRTYEIDKAIEYCQLFLRQTPKKHNPSNASCYFNLGFNFLLLGKYEEATANLLECLEISRIVDGEKSSQVGDCYSQLGKAFELLEELSTAISYYFKALKIYKSIHKDQYNFDIARSFHDIASIYSKTGEYEEALVFFEQAVEIKKRVLNDENHYLIADSWSDIGMVYQKLGKYDKALSYLLQAQKIRVSIYGQKDHNVGKMHENLGLIYMSLGEYQKAIEHHLNSLEIYQMVFGERHKSVAEAYGKIGTGYHRLGEFAKAIDMHFKSAEIYELTGEGKGLAVTYNNIGVAFLKLDQYSKAIEFLEKARGLYELVYGKSHSLFYTLFNNFGFAHNKLGEYEKALDYQLKSVEMYKKHVGEKDADMANAYNNLGSIYNNLKEYQRAIELHLKSEEMYRSISYGNHPDIGNSYYHLGVVYCNIEEYDKAIDFYLKGIEVKELAFGEKHVDIALAYDGLGTVYERMKDKTNALKYYSTSIEIYYSLKEERFASRIENLKKKIEKL